MGRIHPMMPDGWIDLWRPLAIGRKRPVATVAVGGRLAYARCVDQALTVERNAY